MYILHLSVVTKHKLSKYLVSNSNSHELPIRNLLNILRERDCYTFKCKLFFCVSSVSVTNIVFLCPLCSFYLSIVYKKKKYIYITFYLCMLPYKPFLNMIQINQGLFFIIWYNLKVYLSPCFLKKSINCFFEPFCFKSCEWTQ
jgi:hypothetical protein